MRSGSAIGSFVVMAAVIAALSIGAQGTTPPGITDTAPHPPPSTGAFAYASYAGPALGQAFVDPVFGTTIRRLTAGGSGEDDLYAKNMWWNADATKYYHRGQILDTSTGAVTHTVPTGDPNFDAGFDPVNPNVVYYIQGATIHRVVLGAAGARTDAVWLTVPSSIHSQGGSENWLSADGRILAVSYGSEPAVHVFDTANLAAGPFAGAIPQGDPSGYSAVLPSGNHVVTVAGNGFNGSGTTFRSYAVDLASRTLSTSGVAFWDLCGDHSAFISPSDGKDYAVTTDCYATSRLVRVDVTIPLTAGHTEAQELGAHKSLIDLKWMDLHATAVAKGPLRDWAFIDTETSNNITAAYQGEIIGFNVLTGETRRLAHHRSKISTGDYYTQPRISVSWGGEFVGWATNFQGTKADVVDLAFGGAGSGGSGGGGGGGGPVPVDCVVGAFGPWTPINATTEQRTRTILTAPANGGASCPALVEQRPIVVTPPPVNVACVAGPWTIQSQAARSVTLVRAIVTPASGTGRACGVLTTTVTTPR